MSALNERRIRQQIRAAKRQARSERRQMRNNRKMRLACAVHLYRQFRQQIVGDDWFDAATESFEMASWLKVDRQYEELMPVFPRLKMTEEP